MITLENLSPEDRAKFEALQADIQHGADELDRGEGVDIDWDVKLAQLRAAYDKRKASKSNAIGLTDLLLACPSSFEIIERERDDSEPIEL